MREPDSRLPLLSLGTSGRSTRESNSQLRRRSTISLLKLDPLGAALSRRPRVCRTSSLSEMAAAVASQRVMASACRGPARCLAALRSCHSRPTGAPFSTPCHGYMMRHAVSTVGIFIRTRVSLHYAWIQRTRHSPRSECEQLSDSCLVEFRMFRGQRAFCWQLERCLRLLMPASFVPYRITTRQRTCRSCVRAN
jgi:hypothetical protein